jgi:hypothetical protein
MRNRRPSSGDIARGRALERWRQDQLLNPRVDAGDDDLDPTPTLPAYEVAQLRMEARCHG